MAGIGVMGRNNLAIVPGYGPGVRFRAIRVDLAVPGCPGYCTRACPMDAFAAGRYSRERCMARMDADKASGRAQIDHCRECELACPERGGV